MIKSNNFPILMALVLLMTIALYPAPREIYCHVSLVEGDVYIIRPPHNEAVKAVVNYPLIPGDQMYTNSTGKCEIQFGNGTIMRLARHTDLRFRTLLSPAMTTNKNITTLHLEKGHVYSMNQVYREEIFQIITPTAAVKMTRRSASFIQVNKSGDTHVYVERGKVGLIYTNEKETEKQKFIGKGEGFWIVAGQELKRDSERQDEKFSHWNQRINKNFKDLHYGISKVPQVIYRYSPGIVKFAERFSTRYGVWTYNDLFGYVWQPSDKSFIWRRPFWDANYVRLGDDQFLVPNQPWGWAPAHLGTWFWSENQGWIWIPGNAFSEGICSVGLKGDPQDLIWGMLSPYYWIDMAYGNFELYTIYRIHGSKKWRQSYENHIGRPPAGKKPSLEGLPANIKDIITRVNALPVATIEKHLSNHRLPENLFSRPVQRPGLDNRINLKKSPAGNPVKTFTSKLNQIVRCQRDWNPDSQWSKKMGVRIYYSPSRNAMISPEMGLLSSKINSQQKQTLRRSLVHRQFVKSLHGTIKNWITGSGGPHAGRTSNGSSRAVTGSSSGGNPSAGVSRGATSQSASGVKK